MKAILIIFVLFISVHAIRKTYENYHVYEVIPKTEHHLRFFNKLEEDSSAVTILSNGGIDNNIELLVAPKFVKQINGVFSKFNLKFKTVTTNAAKELSETFKRLDAKKAFDLNDYNTFEDILVGIDQFVSNCPSGANCQLEDIGSSYENRPLRLLKLTKAGVNRQVIWMDSTIHAREWLSTATLLNVMNRMIKQEDADAINLLNRFDFYFLTVMNPDGYTHSHNIARFWRKNRTPNFASTCIGTDLNRNYDINWGNDGTSTNPCSDTYGGTSAGSEPETDVIQTYGSSIISRVRLWITVHTYGRYILTPYGHTENGICAFPPDYADILSAANTFADAVQSTYNTVWRRGSTCSVLYGASGSTCDWAYSKGVKYSFTPELRGSNFNPAPSQIPFSFNEFWNGLVAVVGILP